MSTVFGHLLIATINISDSYHAMRLFIGILGDEQVSIIRIKTAITEIRALTLTQSWPIRAEHKATVFCWLCYSPLNPLLLD
jgi:hypothetical protein